MSIKTFERQFMVDVNVLGYMYDVNMSLYYNNFCVMIAFFGINFFI